MPIIGKWIYDENYLPAHWLGAELDGKTLWEPINIIFMDGFATSTNDARDRMREALIQANFTIRTIHSTGYKGMIDNIWYEQEPTESNAAFSDANYLLDNNHGRMFGAHYKQGVYYYTGALSRETLSFFTHKYVSFNIARNTLADNLNSLTTFKKGELKWLDNIYNTSTDTTGDHDGNAILIAAQDTFEYDDNYLYANYIYDSLIQKHSISPTNDIDWVKFYINETKNVTIETLGPTGCDTRIWLYNSLLSQLDYNDNSGNDYYSKINITLDSGIYYIKIDEQNQDNLIPLYKIKLNITDITGNGGFANHITQKDNLKVFPNPFNSSCQISAPAGAKIEIYDIHGKLVKIFHKRPYIWQPDEQINNGVYIMKTTTKMGKIGTKKIVYLDK